jgi:glycolate oxidase iron-sulfur subunit
MRTNFSAAQLADPHLVEAERSLRSCIHCGICTATCPTYVLIGDERDAPRGRIVMMQQMLESSAAPTDETVHHVDRCLSCLGCRTACPSSVDYARLVDAARVHIEQTYRRPWHQRLMRSAIAHVMTKPALVKVLLRLAVLGRWLPGQLGRLARTPMQSAPGAPIPAVAASAPRVALMPGRVQQALAPGIDEAAQRLLARRGVKLETLNAGCCGALSHHLGRDEEARAFAKRAIEAFEQSGCQTVTITATGCGAQLKDYGYLFAGDPEWESRARKFAAAFRDITQIAEPARTERKNLRVAYHMACSAQNGLKLGNEGSDLLKAAGFEVVAIPEGHLCCGSAGSYSILQPELSGALRARKLENIRAVAPDVIASGNIGCLSHLAGPDAPPLVHLAELIDWAEGGPKPVALEKSAH